MPMDPRAADGITDRLGRLYGDAETTILGHLAETIADGADDPDWAERQTTQRERFRRSAMTVAAQLQDDAPGEVAAAVVEAERIGRRAADTDLAALPAGSVPDGATPDGKPSRRTRAAAVQAVTEVSTFTQRIPDVAGELYGRVVAQVGVRSSAPGGTTRDAIQQALYVLGRQGVTGFTDAAGRRWSLQSYIEMKARTLVNQELIAAHTARMVERGQTLVVVSSHRNPAPQCQPFEGQILSLDGSTGTVERRDLTGDGTVRVRIAATMDDARAAGFQHPNCRHAVSAYIPGASRTFDTEPNPEGYRATQQQRYLERRIREARRLKALATTPAERRRQAARLTGYQDRLLAHIDQWDLKRRPLRERDTPRVAPPDGQTGSGSIILPRTTPPGGRTGVADRGLDAEDLVPEVPATRHASDATRSLVASTRERLPRSREDWRAITAPRQIRPAESRWDRTVWEARQRIDAADAARAQLLLDRPEVAEYADWTPIQFIDKVAEVMRRRETIEGKLARARTQKSIDAWRAKMLAATDEIADLESIRDTMTRPAMYRESLDRALERGPDPWQLETTPPLTGPGNYRTDPNGKLLPPPELDAHLDDTLEVGRALRADLHKVLDNDPELRRHRQIRDTIEAMPDDELTGDHIAQLREATAAIPRREQTLVRELVAEFRDTGGHRQRLRALTARDGHGNRPATDDTLAAFREAEELFPTDWLRLADDRGELIVGVRDRAHFDASRTRHASDYIATNDERDRRASGYGGAFSNYAAETAAHELGHRMEQAVPGLTQLEYTLVRRRGTRNGVLEDTVEMYKPGSGEFSYADKWANPYTGKTYERRNEDDPATVSAEAFQVGMQDVFGRSAMRFGDPDGDLEAFVLGVLTLL